MFCSDNLDFDFIFVLKISQLDGLQNDIILSSYTTFKIGGPAKHFYIAKTAEDLMAAIYWAKENELPFFILGGGSNLLVSDQGFAGLVIRNQTSGLEVKNNVIWAESGVLWGRAVAEATRQGLSGLEWAIGIPGTLGGAVYGNSGAFGRTIGEMIKKVIFREDKNSDLSAKEYNQPDCRFAYRDSIFKEKNGVIISLELNLSKSDSVTVREKILEHLASRKNKIPPYPSAGSVFKNLEVKFLKAAVLEKIPPEVIKGGKVPAGYLIQSCSLRGRTIGGAKINEEHANFILNYQEAKASEIKQLIDICKMAVKKKFDIDLVEEIRYLGNF